MSVTIAKLDGDDAMVQATTRQQNDGKWSAPQSETLQMHRQKFGERDQPNSARNGLWGILAETDEPNQSSLKGLAFFLSQKPGSLPAIRRSMGENRLKRLGLGTMQFLQDWDEVFCFDNEHLSDALMPYLKDMRPFEIPGTHEIWHFNENLSGVSQDQVNEVAQTVLFYDGAAQKLNFRWDDTSPVCFCDGHVELVSREKTAHLRWTP